jgi:trk system potassium uptake protein TrkA
MVTEAKKGMYIIVVGGGKVGFHLAKELVEANHEVLVIEQDSVKAKEIADELGDIVLDGDGCEATILEKAGTARADMLLAVTGDDQDNLVACQVAKQRFNVARTVARINDPKNEQFFRKLEVDITVSATSAIMAHIEQELPTHHLSVLVKIKGSDLELVEMRIPDDSRVVNQPVRNIMLPYQSMVVLVVGEDGLPKVPSAETVIHAGDEVVAVTLHESEQQLRDAMLSPASARGF